MPPPSHPAIFKQKRSQPMIQSQPCNLANNNISNVTFSKGIKIGEVMHDWLQVSI